MHGAQGKRPADGYSVPVKRNVGVALLLAVACAAPLPSQAAGEPDPILQRLDGYWNCTDAHGVTSTRAYVAMFGGPRRAAGEPRDNVYGREDGIAGGRPVTSWERISKTGSSYSIESSDGSAANSVITANMLRFSATGASGKQLDIVYAFSGDDALDRTVSFASTTESSEHCTRQPIVQTAAPTCDEPNRPGTTVTPAAPPNPPVGDWATAPAVVDVDVHVVLDDRSQLVWADVYRSNWDRFDREAIEAARWSTFRTALHDCKPVAQEFAFIVTFRNRPR